MAPPLFIRASIGSDVNGVKDTFSSWDKCMAKAYCKWPVIIAIIIGSLIALSILSCIFRCFCGGVRCCGDCAQCITMCGRCCSLGGGRRRRRGDNYAYAPPPPQPQQPMPYMQPGMAPPMMYGAEPPRPAFARFDVVGKKKKAGGVSGAEDSLPPMPSWDNATSYKVEDHDADAEDHEMARLDSAAPNAGHAAAQAAEHEPMLPPAAAANALPRTQSPFAQSPYAAPGQNPYGPANGQELGVTAGAGTGAAAAAAPAGYAPSHYSTAYAPSANTAYDAGAAVPQPNAPWRPQQPQTQYQAYTPSPTDRQPAQGSWRDV